MCLNVNEKIKLFDSLVSSVLNYASEVWGYDDCKDIEIVHNKFCRYLLSVKKSTNIAAMYGELGRMPLRVVRKLRMLKYWIRILENSNENPFVYKIYEMMYNDVIQQIILPAKEIAYLKQKMLRTRQVVRDQDLS